MPNLETIDDSLTRDEILAAFDGAIYALLDIQNDLATVEEKAQEKAKSDEELLDEFNSYLENAYVDCA